MQFYFFFWKRIWKFIGVHIVLTLYLADIFLSFNSCIIDCSYLKFVAPGDFAIETRI